MEIKLKKIYSQINTLNEEIPGQLAKKIQLYAEAMQWIGKCHAEATFSYKKAYAERKRAWAETIVNTKGTGVVKEGQAELASYDFRMKEAEYEAEMHKWKNALDSTKEIIQALKKQLETLNMEYNHAG